MSRSVLALAILMCGMACVGIGVAWIYPPAGLIVIGVALVVLALFAIDVEGSRS